MAETIYSCRCEICKSELDHPKKEQHKKLNFFLNQLSKEQRRWFAALEYDRLDVSQKDINTLTGIAPTTISRGQRELDEWLKTGSITKPPFRGGKKKLETKQPELKLALENLISHEIAGDPMNGYQWVRSSSRQLAKQLNDQGYKINYCTVIRILKEMGYSLKANKKKLSPRGDDPDRDKQFKYIDRQRKSFASLGHPIISVDTKKKELIGAFKMSGKAWSKQAEQVFTHDFTSVASYRAVPYGIYDISKNSGYIFVGISGDTPEFAVDSIERWWKLEGKTSYPNSKSILVFADSGGSNGYKTRAWKKHLQEKLCNKHSLTVTVCHYPPGCSKWNPIERLLFSQISINWAGRPLKNLETMLGYIRGTTTKTGLEVKAFLQSGNYQSGEKFSKQEMALLNLNQHATCSKWNYTIEPQKEFNRTKSVSSSSN